MGLHLLSNSQGGGEIPGGMEQFPAGIKPGVWEGIALEPTLMGQQGIELLRFPQLSPGMEKFPCWEARERKKSRLSIYRTVQIIDVILY